MHTRRNSDPSWSRDTISSPHRGDDGIVRFAEQPGEPAPRPGYRERVGPYDATRTASGGGRGRGGPYVFFPVSHSPLEEDGASPRLPSFGLFLPSFGEISFFLFCVLFSVRHCTSKARLSVSLIRAYADRIPLHACSYCVLLAHAKRPRLTHTSAKQNSGTDGRASTGSAGGKARMVSIWRDSLTVSCEHGHALYVIGTHCEGMY